MVKFLYTCFKNYVYIIDLPKYLYIYTKQILLNLIKSNSCIKQFIYKPKFCFNCCLTLSVVKAASIEFLRIIFSSE